jgi:uncharacterized protein (TIGR04255 family)
MTLPAFDDPPVVEVALSFSFDPLERFRSAHAGRFWDKVRGEFPNTDDQMPLAQVVEQPGGPAPPPRLQMVKPQVRTWLLSGDGTQLLQLQRDRIAYNWRRNPTGAPYPSFSAVERRFRELLPLWEDFIAQEELGSVVPTQVEVTYVNHIQEPHAEFFKIFRSWKGSQSEFLPPVEDFRFTLRYIIEDDQHRMVGRLTVNCEPVYATETSEELFRLSLSVRGMPASPEVASALKFLDIGHEWIVRGFAELTTPEMHAKWKRTR